MKRRLWILVTATLAVVLALGTFVGVSSTGAAALTSGYSYVVNGKEVAVGVDPLSLKSGLLIPAAMLDHVGVRLIDRGNGDIVLSREGVTVNLRLGSKSALQGTQSVMLPSAPMKLTGHVYVPAEALTTLGVRVTNESSLLLVDAWPAAKSVDNTSADYTRLRTVATADRYVYPSRDAAVRLEITRLERDLILAPSWTSDPFLRGQAKGLLDQDLLLLQVTLTNSSNKLISFPANSYYLTDNLGSTYTPSSLPISGDLFGNLVSTGKSSGVLVYPTPHSDASTVTLYVLNAGALEHLVTYQLSSN